MQEAEGGGDEERANPLNQPDSTESTLQTSGISRVSLTSPFCVYTSLESHLQSLLPLGIGTVIACSSPPV